VKRKVGRPRKQPLPTDVTVFLQDQYNSLRRSEVVGLIEKGVFELVEKADILYRTRIFNSRFVDEVKNKGTNKAFEKSRLVV
jgi:hypothetical protein